MNNGLSTILGDICSFKCKMQLGTSHRSWKYHEEVNRMIWGVGSSLLFLCTKERINSFALKIFKTPVDFLILILETFFIQISVKTRIAHPTRDQISSQELRNTLVKAVQPKSVCGRERPQERLHETINTVQDNHIIFENHVPSCNI